jgi:hypothetical protein
MKKKLLIILLLFASQCAQAHPFAASLMLQAQARRKRTKNDYHNQKTKKTLDEQWAVFMKEALAYINSKKVKK